MLNKVETEGAFLVGWEGWRRERFDAVNAPDGAPTLEATYWIDEVDNVPDVPGWWSSDGRDVHLSLPTGVEAIVDGSPAYGQIVAYADGHGIAPRIRFPDVTVQITTRGGRHGVRLFNHRRAQAVEGIDAFEPSRGWVVEGMFVPTRGRATQAYGFALESAPREIEVPGTVSFTIQGRTCETRPFRDGGELVLVFADRTTGDTTKPPSRFLGIVPPDAEARRTGPVELDFNRAFLPPCAFSDEFNCPLPPLGHGFDVAVDAGERWVRWGRDHPYGRSRG